MFTVCFSLFLYDINTSNFLDCVRGLLGLFIHFFMTIICVKYLVKLKIALPLRGQCHTATSLYTRKKRKLVSITIQFICNWLKLTTDK